MVKNANITFCRPTHGNARIRANDNIMKITSPSIAALINKSITSGSFPNQLKRAKVYPIFKNGSKDDPSNYRPISILPTISIFFEKHVGTLMNINKFTNTNQVSDKNTVVILH